MWLESGVLCWLHVKIIWGNINRWTPRLHIQRFWFNRSKVGPPWEWFLKVPRRFCVYLGLRKKTWAKVSTVIHKKTGGPGSIHKAKDQIQLLKEDFSSLGCWGNKWKLGGGRWGQVEESESQTPVERREKRLLLPHCPPSSFFFFSFLHPGSERWKLCLHLPTPPPTGSEVLSFRKIQYFYQPSQRNHTASEQRH